jgi:hypothetical protein
MSARNLDQGWRAFKSAALKIDKKSPTGRRRLDGMGSLWPPARPSPREKDNMKESCERKDLLTAPDMAEPAISRGRPRLPIQAAHQGGDVRLMGRGAGGYRQ